MTVRDKKVMKIEGIPRQLSNILNFILESSNNTCSIVNSKLIIEWINEEPHQKILGYTNQDIIGTKVIDLIHPDDIQYLISEADKITNIQEGRATLRIKNKNKGYKCMELTIHMFESYEGFNKFFLIGRDMSERRNIESRLKESEEMYRLFMEKSHDFILILGNEFIIEHVNQPNFKDILGYSNEDLIGKKIFHIIHHGYHKITLEVLKEESTDQSKEIILWDKKGHNVHVEIKGSTYRNSKGENKILIAALDITKRKETKKRLISSEKRNRDALERSEFYKDLFSHDINNILQTILTTVEIGILKLQDIPKTDEIKRLLKDITSQVERGSNLVSNVQILSKIESIAPLLKKMEVIQVLKEAVKFIKTSYPQEINIKIESYDPTYYSYTNELLLEVFENLLINSVKHNDNDIINILIRVSRELRKNDEYIRLEFEDNGRGIDDFKKKKVFKRYFSKDSSLNGMGLGLSLVKKIIDIYKGKIWIENKIQDDHTKGSRFIILLPKI